MKALQEDYQVTIDAFHGPLDLLLYLIRRAEVDILDIPVATITEQFLAFLKQLDDIDVDDAGDFLVMASTLVEIKSRSLTPASEEGEGDGHGESSLNAEDPRYELVQQLLAYQRYRIAAEELEKRRSTYLLRYPGQPDRKVRHEDRAEPVDLELEDLHILDLSETYERIVASIDFARLGDHIIEINDTPIALHQEDLLDRLERVEGHRLTLQQAFEGANLGERIGLFLATLELVRLRRVVVEQDDMNSDIELNLNTDPEDVLVIDMDDINIHHAPDGTHIDVEKTETWKTENRKEEERL